MKVGVYENAPKVFTSESGKPSGIFIDIIESIAKSEGWDLRYVAGTFAEGLDRLTRGEIDLMPDVAYTSDRDKLFAFHKVAVLSSWSQIYAARGSGIRSIVDLNGKRIAVLERSVQQETFNRLTNGFGIQITIITASDYKTMFERVARGEVDAAITNRFYGLMHAKKAGLEDTAIIFEPSDLFFAATRNDPKRLLNSIDSRLSDLKKDSQSEYYASLKRWTSEEVRFKLPAWLQILGLVLGIALLLSLAGSFILKHQVDTRTRELRTSEQKYRELVQNANSIILRWNRAGEITFLNEFGQNFFGYSEAEILGRHVVGTIVPESESTGRDLSPLMDEICARPEEFENNINENMLRNGDRVWISWTNKIVKNNAGQVLEILSIGSDITERKQTEEELDKHRLHLEEMVNERTVELKAKQTELEAANNKLKDLDRLKSMFIASMSHELRTPLNSIIGFTGIILQGMTGEINAEQRDQLQRVLKAGKHLLALITDVIDISKIEAGKIEAYAEEFPLDSVINDALSELKLPIKEKGLEIGVSMIPEKIILKTDRKRLFQCVLNYLSNAVKYSEKGTITILAEEKGDKMQIKVTDTGIGIKEEDLSRLFQSFIRLDSNLRMTVSGTGLGLYLTKKLATEVLGGEVSVTSTYGKGSTFMLSIPKNLRNKTDQEILPQ
ncbi:MAG: transporter substrate-binding domain-containing protein [Nitrospirae bacterium]|nr:transporter substrate-binding domain-containing protein [Nitrospirota bacterium]